MNIDDLEVGCFYRYALGEKRDPSDRRIWWTSWTWARVVRISADKGRVTVWLVDFPAWRARSVKPARLMA